MDEELITGTVDLKVPLIAPDLKGEEYSQDSGSQSG